MVTERHESLLFLLGVTLCVTPNTLEWLVAIIMYFWCLHKWNAVSLIWCDVVNNLTLAMFHVSSLKTKLKFQQIGMFMFRLQSESADLSDSNIVLSVSLFSFMLYYQNYRHETTAERLVWFCSVRSFLLPLSLLTT